MRFPGFSRFLLGVVVIVGPARLFAQISPDSVWVTPWENVPEYYQRWAYPDFSFPGTLELWENQRLAVRGILMRLLGDIPARPAQLDVKTTSSQQQDGFVVERFVFDNQVDGLVPGYLLIPDPLEQPAPAVLVMHGHSSSKESILGTVPSSQAVGPLLARNGFVVMAIDSYFNGERRGTGPAGTREMQEQWDQELSQFKINLWFGRSLWGMMLRDEQIALDYLLSRPEVDPDRVGASGMSMGSTRSWWLAAIDERVKSVVGVACFTRYRELIEQGYLRAHAIYYYVPGILRYFDTEAVMGLLAPRPFLALTGDSDAGSPLAGIKVLERKLEEVYALYGAPDNFQSILYSNTGHVYTDEMKLRMLEWFRRTLRDRTAPGE
jgi:dienelactone hydrolase